MKICAISDTHGKHRQLNIPKCDLLIHAGDLTNRGELDIIEDFCNWTNTLDVKHICVISGNHEVGFEHNPYKRPKVLEYFKNAGIHYLEDSGIEIDGYKIWGSPVTKFFYDWEWNRQPGKDIDYHWGKIPQDINILITHEPAFNILDKLESGEHIGCKDLSVRINKLKQLKLHVVGHIHNSYGQYRNNGIIHINAASCTEQYEPTNPPIEIEL